MQRHRRTSGVFYVATILLACPMPGTVQAQLSETSLERDHPAIVAGARNALDDIARLQREIDQGSVKLTFEEHTGYLRSLLAALRIPVESQVAVFSKTSLQAPLIHPRNPRTLFFNDVTSVAWMRGGFIEIATHDAQRGALFYALRQTPSDKPQLQRDDRCLTCHFSQAALGVPGFLLRSIPTASDGVILPWLGNFNTTHDSPIAERWGGWYVTGDAGSAHLGNLLIPDKRMASLPTSVPPALERLDGWFDTTAYLTPYSDVAALLVLEHQMHMLNILTRLNWEARIALSDGGTIAGLSRSIEEAADYFLFVNEAPLGQVRGTSGFTEKFSTQGPFDKQGRSLRQLRLNGRLMEYPCSYMIYAPAFDALPASARDALYRRLWRILSGELDAQKYARLSHGDRRAITQILRDTKQSLPAYFQVSAIGSK